MIMMSKHLDEETASKKIPTWHFILVQDEEAEEENMDLKVAGYWFPNKNPGGTTSSIKQMD